MVEALFGSKTRVKLLQLFLNNPGKSFYVREITRLIDEQINSVRRELANMLNVGIILSHNADKKLYYQVNQRYKYYVPLRAIFADQKVAALEQNNEFADQLSWRGELSGLPKVRLVLLAGLLAGDSSGEIDILLVGDVPSAKLKKLIKNIESQEGRELNYTLMSYDDFYYRFSLRDRFITAILSRKYQILIDKDNLLRKAEQEETNV